MLIVVSELGNVVNLCDIKYLCYLKNKTELFLYLNLTKLWL